MYRRVAKDEVESGAQSVGPVAAHEQCAIRQTQRRGIARGQCRSLGRSIHANAERGAEFRQCGQQQTSGAGAEVQHQSRWLAVGERSDGCLDQRLRLGTRDQRGGRDGKLEAPELAVAHDQRQRFVRLTPSDQRREARHVRRRRGIAQQSLCRDAVRMGQQQTCLQPGIVDARPPQPLGGAIDRAANREAQAAWLAARFACARSSRRFRALASSVRRLAGVANR